MPYVTVNDVTLHYQCLGEGENLLLIHGLEANLAFWYPGVASVLSRHYRVIIYDLRGHGRSEMPTSGYTVAHMVRDLHGLLEHLEVERVHVVGHSFGARIAVHYAELYPEQLTSLTIADTRFQCLQPKMRLREWPYWRIWKQQLEQQGKFLPSDDEFINFHLLKDLSLVSAELNDDGVEQKIRKRSLRRRQMGAKESTRWQRLMSTTSAMQEFEENDFVTEESLSQIAVPTLAVYGEYSHCVPSCWKLKLLITDCQVVLIPKAGHFHPAGRPREFIRTLHQFLQAHLLKTVPTSLQERKFGDLGSQYVSLQQRW